MKRLLLVAVVALLVLGVGLRAWRGLARDPIADLASSDPDLVVAAARQLWFDSQRGIDVGPDLARGLKSPQAKVRSRCVRTLARFNRSAYTDEVAALLRDPDEGVRIQAAVALRTLRDWHDPRPLLQDLQDRGQLLRIRVDLAYALGERGEPAAEATLAGLAGDPSEPARLRQEALLALGQLCARTRVPLLLGILEDPTQELRVRLASAQALGHLRTPEALAALRRVAGHPQGPDRLRGQAAESLACCDGEEAFLRSLATDPKVPTLVRLSAALGSHRQGDPLPGLADLIQEGLLDPSEHVRSKAACLARVTAEPDVEQALRTALGREQDQRVRCEMEGAWRRLKEASRMDPDTALEP